MWSYRNKVSEDIGSSLEQTQTIAQEEYQEQSARSCTTVHAICYLHCQGKCLLRIYKMTHYVWRAGNERLQASLQKNMNFTK